MTDLELNELRSGFASIAHVYAQRALPEDDGMWELICPLEGSHFSVTDILYYYEASTEAMPALTCQALDLPPGSPYSEGVKRVWEDLSHRAPTPRRVLTPEEAARAQAAREAAEAALSPEDREALRQLEELVDDPPHQPSVEKIDWRPDGF